ncbi:MAG: DNA-methyltransferase, partial [Candidatus Nanopelagicaceae bacterium]
LPDNCIDLICTDPPYFKVKKEWWDRQWDKPQGFLDWLDSVAEQWQRILKPNGSLYCFASPKMSARVEVKLGERFNVLGNITWTKPNEPGHDGWHRKCSKDSLRQWYPMSERIIFCEHYGADNIAKGEAGYGAKCDELRGFIFEPLRAYLDGERRRIGATKGEMGRVFAPPPQGEALSNHFWRSGQFLLPQPEQYTKLQQAFPGYFTRPYEELRLEYEELRLEYEELRRPFSVSADVPYTDVWTFPTVSSYPGKHPCEKPAAMLEHIINASTRPGAVVLDCFAGSGSTLVAAKKLGRDFIGIEIDPHWVAVANQKIGNAELLIQTCHINHQPKAKMQQMSLNFTL